jgi:DNA anti-recombination protein RmuC
MAEHLKSLNAVYEMQIKTLQSQVDAYKSQNEKVANTAAQVEAYAAGAKQLATQVADLNKVYGNMLNALS